MGMRSKEPTPGRKAGAAMWEYEAPEHGKSFDGWLAGPYFGLDTHHNFGTKPCRKEMTNGALQCPWCHAKQAPIWRAYVPFFNREYQRRFCIVSEDYLPLLREVQPGQQVRISRAVSSRASSCVEARVWRTSPLPDAVLATIPVAILPSLWRIWNDAELLAWHQADEAKSAAPVVNTRVPFVPPADLDAARGDGAEELEKVKNRLKGRFKVSEAAAGIGADPDETPHRNGKPKPR